MAATVSGTEAPPPPDEPLAYPIVFTRPEQEDGPAPSCLDSAVSLFTALHWLVPVYELAGWVPRQPRAHEKRGGLDGNAGAESPAATRPPEDVASSLQLLELFQPFFGLASKLIPKHTDPYHYVETLAYPTPKGAKTLTRSKVEGDHRAVHRPAHAPQPGDTTSMSATTVTNTTAYFSLLPGHNHFLVYYEEREKLAYFTYLQLDMLRFAWVAVREMVTGGGGGGGVFNLSDGSIIGCARRDLKKNNVNTSPCAVASAEKDAASSAAASAASTSAAVGRGGGNARLHQGTSGNVITGPRKDVIEMKREIAQKRFLREELEEDCQRRWPHTPVAKSCIFSAEEKAETELPPEVLEQMGVANKNVRNSNNKARRGPKYYLGAVELPLLNKKGGAARFKATRWWNNRKDAESAAAEVALSTLRTMK